MQLKTIQQATEILTDVLLRGMSYRAAGARQGVGKSTAERQAKVLVRLVARECGIKGVQDTDISSLALLRNAREEVLKAVKAFDPSCVSTRVRLIKEEDLPAAIRSVRSQSENANRDAALLLLLIATGAKPLEIARLKVCDYIDSEGRPRDPDGQQAEASKGGKRQIPFASQRLQDAMDSYLVERVRRGLGVSGHSCFRGLAPDSSLFLTQDGRPFAVKARGPNDPRPICPVVVAICRRILARAGLQGTTTHALRRQLAQRLITRGASKQRVGELLGISNTRSVGRLLRGRVPTTEELLGDTA
ncbi:hypothetical protein CDN99_15360 [Roseateles aquatilis]|jgi:integrase|uniref:Tyr recombinase domain-containing protein n=1 Tax=Roseateles aquatilis TaxID=431061 RepID=A0A246J8F3_9BURK|nr:tyrosine-type recombinase/integrase [Roseateles aquatilis]MBY0364654.1 tyrosine-type recombinase/integrase [Burkholderiaceae bacterium]OWQ88851.1 hypothetical protein CDN99_15360 [Roseateles aquatilis]